MPSASKSKGRAGFSSRRTTGSKVLGACMVIYRMSLRRFYYHTPTLSPPRVTGEHSTSLGAV